LLDTNKYEEIEDNEIPLSVTINNINITTEINTA